MTTNPVADRIKSSITMMDIFDRYGFEPNQRGFLSCPFHDEKTASLSTYADGTKWKCFGCGRYGTVIDFVMELFHIDFRQAVVRLDNDFGLNLTNQRVNSRQVARIAQERAEKERALKQYRAEYDAKCEAHRRCHILLTCTPTPSTRQPKSDETARELAAAQAELDYLDYWFECNPWR